MFLCRCDCGGITIKDTEPFSSSQLELNGCDDCFSKRMSKCNIKHGGTSGGKTRIFNIWKDMRRRCRNTNGNRTSKDYALRGISVCQEWSDFSVFRDWAQSHGYTDALTIERDDVNGNYEPANCRWIPLSEQCKNTRRTKYIDFMGKTMIAKDAEIALGLQKGSIKDLRYRNHHNITHQEAFDRLLCRAVMTVLNAERMVA